MSTPKTESNPRRRLLQFSLRSLLLLTVICAVALSFWRQRQMNAELTATKEELRATEVKLQDQLHINAIFQGLDLQKTDHLQMFELLQYMTQWGSMKRKTIVRDGASFEVIFYENLVYRIPGSNNSVAVLLRDDKFLDLVFRNTSTRQEAHDLALEDANDDGKMDVVFNCSPQFRNRSRSKPFKISYEITTLGFRKIE